MQTQEQKIEEIVKLLREMSPESVGEVLRLCQVYVPVQVKPNLRLVR